MSSSPACESPGEKQKRVGTMTCLLRNSRHIQIRFLLHAEVIAVPEILPTGQLAGTSCAQPLVLGWRVSLRIQPHKPLCPFLKHTELFPT